jgi:hypothetical protein
MNNIDTNKLITFILYLVITITLTNVLYKMYNDFLSETYFNIKKFNLKEKFTNSDIEQKLNYINLLKKINSKKPIKPEIIQEEIIQEDFNSETIFEVIPETLKIEKSTERFYPFSENINLNDYEKKYIVK